MNGTQHILKEELRFCRHSLLFRVDILYTTTTEVQRCGDPATQDFPTPLGQ